MGLAMTLEKVVVSGAGPVSTIGVGRDAFRVGLRAQREAGAPVQVGPTIDVDLRQHIRSEKAYLDRTSALALAASSLALADARVDLAASAARQVGVILGTWLGPTATASAYHGTIAKRGPQAANPLLFTHSMANVPASLVAIEHKLRGENLTFTSGQLSGFEAIAYAYDLLHHGRVSALLAGGVDAIEPADCTRGAVDADPAEGAAVVLLETGRGAAQRGVAVYAELAAAAAAPPTSRVDTVARIGAVHEAAMAAANLEDREVCAVVTGAGEECELGRAERAAIASRWSTGRTVTVLSPRQSGAAALGCAGAFGVIAGALEVQQRGGAVVVDATDGRAFRCLVMTPPGGQ